MPKLCCAVYDGELAWNHKSPMAPQHIARTRSHGSYVVTVTPDGDWEASYTSIDGHEITFGQVFQSLYEAKEFCDRHYLGRVKK